MNNPELLDDEKIGLTWDICLIPECFATGVIVAKNGGNDLLRDWSNLCVAGTERGPQEALNKLLREEPDYEIGYIKINVRYFIITLFNINTLIYCWHKMFKLNFIKIYCFKSMITFS